MEHRRPGRVVELFAGVGGFRLGLERTFGGFTPERGFVWNVEGDRDWEVVWANQWEPASKAQPAFDNYVANLVAERPELPAGELGVVNEDIAKVLDAELGIDGADPLDPGRYGFPEEFELLVGGFPCQDYSVAKPLSQADGIEGKKGVLWWEFTASSRTTPRARAARERRPAPEVPVDPARSRLRGHAGLLRPARYRVEWRVVNAADHGFPQRRRRVFIYATLEDDGLALVESECDRTSDETAGTWGREVIADTGVLAAALPCELRDPGEYVALGQDDDLDPFDVSETFGRDERNRPLKVSPFRNAGVMSGGVVWTANVDVPPSSAEGTWTLGDVLQPLVTVLDEHPEVVIPDRQLDFSDAPVRNSWNYHKGAKREERRKPGGFTYHYTEGAVAFPEPLEKAARTVLTGEGGTSASRFKLVVRQVVDGDEQLAALPASIRTPSRSRATSSRYPPPDAGRTRTSGHVPGRVDGPALRWRDDVPWTTGVLRRKRAGRGGGPPHRERARGPRGVLRGRRSPPPRRVTRRCRRRLPDERSAQVSTAAR